MVEVEAGVVAEGVGVRAIVEAMQRRSTSRSRWLSRSACAASNRSHRAINSSTLATIRCCSARGAIRDGKLVSFICCARIRETPFQMHCGNRSTIVSKKN